MKDAKQMADTHRHGHDHHHHGHCGHHHNDISEKTIKGLIFSFVLNMALSVVEIVGGIIGGSISLIGDALHNTFDAFSILIAVIAFKIGQKKANETFSFGYKRAEIVGGFINLILLFVSGAYLMIEAVSRLISPHPIDGMLIVYVSLLALAVDLGTAFVSMHGSKNNANMKMVFLHNLSDALGSLGVIVAGLCAHYFGWMFVDGLIAALLALYMMQQAIAAFMPMTHILMNAQPGNIDTNAVKTAILEIDGIKDVHHIHIWNIDEHTPSLDCHVVADDTDLLHEINAVLSQRFGINHTTVQMEKVVCVHRECV